MANKSTKTTQTNVWMAQYNEQTRLQDLSCTPSAYQPTRALVIPTLSVHYVEPSTHLVCVVFVDSLAIPTSPNIVKLCFVSCSLTFCQVT